MAFVISGSLQCWLTELWLGNSLNFSLDFDFFNSLDLRVGFSMISRPSLSNCTTYNSS